MKHLLLLFALIFSTSFIYGQDTDIKNDKKLNFGIRHGYSNFNTSARIKFDNGTSIVSNNELNLYLGFFIEKRISEKFRLRLEANFSPSTPLEFPLLLKYNISNKFSLYGGIQLDYSPNGGSTTEAFKNKEFGGSIVIGAELKLSKHWFLEARYTHGLTNQHRIFNGFSTEPVFGKRSSFSLGIIYKFYHFCSKKPYFHHGLKLFYNS